MNHISSHRGMVALLNDRGVRGAQIEHIAIRSGKKRRGWYINGVFAGHSAREAKTAIRVNPEQFHASRTTER